MQFQEFAIFQKMLELLQRYGINPMDVVVYHEGSADYYRFRFRPHSGTPKDQLEAVRQIQRNLGIEEGHSSVDVPDPAAVYSLLCEALEKAPKSFTRYR